MRIATSNIALTAFDHGDELMALADMGFEGLEVAPSRVWDGAGQGVAADAVAAYRRQVEAAGLTVVGLHSLFFDRPDLGIFKGPETTRETLDYLEDLSAMCRDLGGRTLIYGSATGRPRGNLSRTAAHAEAVAFMGDLCARTEKHGTVFCFEPLGPKDADFVNSASESLAIVEDVASPGMAVQLDAKAMVENDEVADATFDLVAGRLAHFHANEPGLNLVGSSGKVDHAFMGRALKRIGYGGWVSNEQRMLSERPLDDLARAALVLRANYA